MKQVAGHKRSRRTAFDEDVDQLQAAILQGIMQDGELEQVAEAVFQKAINTPSIKQELQDERAWNIKHQNQLVFGLRRTLQALTNSALTAAQPLMKYSQEGQHQSAVSVLLKAAIGLAQKKQIGKDHAFQLFEDIVETGDIEEVKSAFKLVYKHWDVMDYWDNPLVMQKACNQFTKRLSNEQDAEFLGTVLTLVAKILPFNHQAGINKMWTVNQHPIHMDDTVEPSVDGRDAMDEKLYKQLWELQNAFQDPRNQSEPNRWAETKQKIEAVLAKLKQEDIGVASTTTAVPQENGQSVIVKYLTSSKLTLLQLTDAAFRRTLLVQCLVLLHACAHPRTHPNKPAPELPAKLYSELQALQQQLYEELNRTPEQGQAFTDVMKTVLDRETAFVAWKSAGAPEYWQKQGQGLPTAPDSALIRALPKRVPKVQRNQTAAEAKEEQSHKPDTDVSRMWDNSGAEQDLYRNNRDSVLLPSVESLFGRIGEELIPDNVRQRNKYATAKALLLRDSAGKEHLGPDPLYTFRCQRMLQRADMALWEQTAQLEQPGDRLELAFATLYPDKVPQGWQKPVLIESSGPRVGQAAFKGQAAKPAATPATSGAQEDEAGDKQGADGTLTPADSVASPDALNPVIPDGSKPADPGELSTNDQPAEDAVMAEAQDSAVQGADTATPVSALVAEDTPADTDKP